MQNNIQDFSQDENIVHNLIVEILRSKNATSDKGVPVKEILDLVSKKIPDDLKRFNVYRLLRKSDNSDFSPINSGGPWRGYYLTDVNQSEIDLKKEITTIGSGNLKISEEDLYPLVADWLRDEKNFQRVSSQHAGKRGGAKWQNPDIVALNPIEKFGLFDIEILTCEVKPSEESWRSWIFEAVAHRLRADRSYFVFRTKNISQKIESEIYLYAEKFRVGVIVIYLPDEKIPKLKKYTNLNEQEKAEFLDMVAEIIPAPRESIDISAKLEFIRNLGISDTQDIYGFGDKI